MGIADNLRSELMRKGLPKEEIDLRLHNRAQLFWLSPLILISGLFLFVILYALLFGNLSPDWSVTGPILMGSGVAFFFCVKKILSMQSAEDALKSRREGNSVAAERELEPVSPPENVTSNSPTKENASTVGIVAIGLGISSLVMPYFAAVLFAPVALICAVIALTQGDKSKGGVGLVLAAIGLFHVVNISDKINDVGNNLQRELRTLNDDAAKGKQEFERALRALK